MEFYWNSENIFKKFSLIFFYPRKRSTKLTIRWQRTSAYVLRMFAVSTTIFILILGNERTKMFYANENTYFTTAMHFQYFFKSNILET